MKWLAFIKDKIVRYFCTTTWSLWERLGFYVVPKHFYYPIPNSKTSKLYDYDKMFSMEGLYFDDTAMNSLLNDIASYNNEYRSLYTPSEYETNGDGSVLYGMVRIIKPNMIIEVGSGNSTYVSTYAMDRNVEEGKSGYELIAIEPYPREVLLDLAKKSPQIKLISKPVQQVNENLFQQLGKGDILFIDSTHNITVGNDVHFLYLKVLPNIPVGTIVHIHDIRFPQDYPRTWVINKKFFWNEQYLLQLFLSFNDSFEVLFASNYMKLKYPQKFSESVTGLDDKVGWPGSFWIKRVK